MTLELTWNDFDEAVMKMAKAIGQIDFLTGIYGVPRGGLVLAVALSHHVDLPFLMEPKPGAVVVDDVIETGKTLDTLLAQLRWSMWPIVWCNKTDRRIPSVLDVSPKQWIVFPWEAVKNANTDAAAYYTSRKINA